MRCKAPPGSVSDKHIWLYHEGGQEQIEAYENQVADAESGAMIVLQRIRNTLSVPAPPYTLGGGRNGSYESKSDDTVPRRGRRPSRSKHERNERIKELAKVNGSLSHAKLAEIAAADVEINETGEPITKDIVRNVLKRNRGKKSRH